MWFRYTGAKMTNIRLEKEMKMQKGFSLIELMMVVAIISIIASIAIPAYQRNIQKSSHDNAMNELLDIMRAQENYFANNFSYTDDLSDINYSNPHTVESDKYRISAGTCADGSAITSCVLLTATPINGQPRGAMTLNSRGEKTQNGSSGWKF